jgi:hypothetical protein
MNRLMRKLSASLPFGVRKLDSALKHDSSIPLHHQKNRASCAFNGESVLPAHSCRPGTLARRA